MIVPQINDNVRKLLLDSQFVEFVLDASDEASGTNPAWVSYAKRLQAKFAKSDIAEAIHTSASGSRFRFLLRYGCKRA